MLRRFSKSRPRFILMIGDDGVLCVPYHLRGLQEPLYAAHMDDAAIASLISLLAKHPQTPVTLLADMLAQDFRVETLPRLSPFDRPKLIARRLKQAFPQARLTASFNLKSARAQILMAGLHGKSPLFDWLDRLKTHTPPIGLLPVEAASLVMTLLPDAKNSWAMLLSRQRTGGFRQIVTHKGELVFSRLTAPLPDDAAPAEIAATLQRDIRASLGYLGRLGLGDSHQLRILLLMPETVQDALENLELPVYSVTCVSPHKTAQHLHLPLVPNHADMYSDVLYAGWVAQKSRLRLPLMLPDQKIVKHMAIVKRYGTQVATAAFLVAFGMTGLQAAGLFTTLFETRMESAKLAQLQSELQQEQQTAAPITEPLGKLRQAVERQRIFSEPVATPAVLLSLLGKNLGDEARLVKLNWQNNDGVPDHDVVQAEVKLIGGPPPTDREQTTAQFEHLAQNLNQNMLGYVVAVTRYPFPAMPDESVSNNKADLSSALPTADITIRKDTP